MKHVDNFCCDLVGAEAGRARMSIDAARQTAIISANRLSLRRCFIFGNKSGGKWLDHKPDYGFKF